VVASDTLAQLREAVELELPASLTRQETAEVVNYIVWLERLVADRRAKMFGFSPKGFPRSSQKAGGNG
jgi:hypothetical protein